MDIYCESRSKNLAQVCLSDSSDCEISGQMRGPFCKYGRTLPANFPVRAGRSSVVDPCYWTPRMPFQYEFTIRVDRADGRTDHHEFLWGLRWCVPHKSDLRLLERRYVVRAIAPTIGQADEFDLTRLRELSTALILDSPSPAICAEASELGVMLLVDSGLDSAELQQLEKYPAVHFAFSQPIGKSDVLFCCSKGSTIEPAIQILDEQDIEPAISDGSQRPIFARRVVESKSLTDMRRSCDWLQRDLSDHGQFAGYLVSAAT